MTSAIECPKPDRRHVPDLPREIGPFQILTILGRGSIGTVHLANNQSLDRLVALKVLSADLLQRDPAFLDRFSREAERTAELLHPNVVRVFSVGEAGGKHYIEMEFVQGMDLRRVINTKGRVKVKEATRIMCDAARALSAAHKKGIIHGNIKPGNLLLSEEGQVKVADFGLPQAPMPGSITHPAGPLLATACTMSPEQARGSATDARSDIYSLGATYYHALTGQAPFDGNTPSDVLLKHAEGPLTWPDGVEDIPPDIRAIVEKMMGKRPEDRYEDCDRAIHALREYFTPKSVPGQPVAHAAPPPKATTIAPPPRKVYVLPRSERKAIEAAKALRRRAGEPPAPPPGVGKRWIVIVIIAALALLAAALLAALKLKSEI